MEPFDIALQFVRGFIIGAGIGLVICIMALTYIERDKLRWLWHEFKPVRCTNCYKWLHYRDRMYVWRPEYKLVCEHCYLTCKRFKDVIWLTSIDDLQTEQEARCLECGNVLTHVRPGKWQCDYCEAHEDEHAN